MEVHGEVRQLKTGAVADGGTAKMRVDRRQRLVTADGLSPRALAMEGSAFRALNPTLGTGLTASSATRTTFSATEALLIFRNTAGAGGAVIVPEYVRCIVTGTGTANVDMHLAGVLDTINRYSSGGTLLTAANMRSDDATAAICSLYAGNVTAAAASAPRTVFHHKGSEAAAPCLAVGDEIMMTFGITDAFGAQGALDSSSDTRYVFPTGPVVIAPGHSLVVHYWATSQSASPTMEVEAGWYEY